MTVPDDTDIPNAPDGATQGTNANAEEPQSARRKAWRYLVIGLLLGGLPVALLITGMVSGIRLHSTAPRGWMFAHAAMALAGVRMGWISWRAFRSIPTPRLPRLGAICVIAIGLISATEAFGLTSFASYLGQHLRDVTRVPTFAGDSTQLERTAIVPTLDTPAPPGRNVIWCSSFQLAWNEIRDNVIGAPLDVLGADELALRLNQAQASRADLEPESVYAVAGWKRDRIVEQIEQEMAAKFPSRELPDFDDYPNPDGIIAYSCLTAHVPFTHPFRPLDEALTFTDSAGTKTKVDGFGLWKAYLSRYKDIREQIEVLYMRWDEQTHSRAEEFALDLCRHSRPYQIVVARINPRDSLADTLDYVRTHIEDFRESPDSRWLRDFGANDELSIPEMFWRIDHRFQELIGREVANVGMPIVEALQTIEFRLDRSGAILESNTTLRVLSLPRYFEFNRPFLIYMKKRDADRPFFVLWIDNAELLTHR